MGEWRPIESAPKDGTRIDILVNGKRCANVHWSFSSTLENGVYVPQVDPHWDGWAYEGVSGWSYTPNYVEDMGRSATHWMPIEPPPSTLTEKE